MATKAPTASSGLLACTALTSVPPHQSPTLAFVLPPISSHLIGSFKKREEERCAEGKEKGLLSRKKRTAFYSHIFYKSI
jgi:hypothetical protein